MFFNFGFCRNRRGCGCGRNGDPMRDRDFEDRRYGGFDGRDMDRDFDRDREMRRRRDFDRDRDGNFDGNY